MRILSGVIGLAFVALCFGGRGLSHSFSALPRTAPIIVLEAREVVRGVGGIQSDHLLVKLTSDGKVVWETYIGRGKKQKKTGTIPANEMSAIQQRLDALDKTILKPRMGQYAVYVDTWNDVSVQLLSQRSTVHVLISNPWGSDSPSVRKLQPMPNEVRAIICEIDALRVEVSGEPARMNCNSSQNPTK